MSQQARIIEGERFDQPLVVEGAIEEPQRYIAEKPYELTKFEFSIIRRKDSSSFWATAFSGATVGLIISALGKALAALLDKKSPSLEMWELCAIVAGIFMTVLFSCIRSKDSKERDELEAVINGHFTANKPRRLHVTANQEAKQ